ncbi:preprotein translocase subunit YajC [Corynebacterium sp. A21]|uniref:preprotein translocase subunit YajC n=1 Tax=Corynebacterium sp. A21 TaxID=3457318 RepID=UPI003FD5CA22
MEIVLLIILLLVFLLPSFLMMRKQRRNQAEIQGFQNNLQLGERVVTVSGLHGAIVSVRETEIDLEIAPGVMVTLEKMSVVRNENQGMIGTADAGHPENLIVEEPRDEFGTEDGTQDGHPENLR